MKVTGKTRLCAVIGDPIEHSLSPAMHNAAFNEAEIDAVFMAFKVTANDLENAVKGMRSLNILGLNVTMPLKTQIINHLDKVDQAVQSLYSVNTVLNCDGILSGYNTDGWGAMEALRQNGANPKGKRILVLGAGGAAKAIAFAAAKETDELVILDRTPEKSRAFAQALDRQFGRKFWAATFLQRQSKKTSSTWTY